MIDFGNEGHPVGLIQILAFQFEIGLIQNVILHQPDFKIQFFIWGILQFQQQRHFEDSERGYRIQIKFLKRLSWSLFDNDFGSPEPIFLNIENRNRNRKFCLLQIRNQVGHGEIFQKNCLLVGRSNLETEFPPVFSGKLHQNPVFPLTEFDCGFEEISEIRLSLKDLPV